MKESGGKIIRAGFLILCCVIVVASTLVLLGKKETFFIDEYSSYGCANNPYGREIVFEDGVTYSSEEFLRMAHDTYSVSEGERFRFDIAWKNLSANVHPPVFYAALHLACSLTPDTFSHWQAGIVNLLFGLVSLFFFWKIVGSFTRSPWLAGILTLAWTCALGLYGTITLLRDYAAAMCGVTMVTWVCLRFLRGKRKAKDLVLLAAASVFSVLCHYYCIVYMFFLCATLCVLMMVRREWKDVLKVCVTEGCAAAAAILIFPPLIRRALTSHRSTEATRNLFSLDLQDFAKRIATFGKAINSSFFGDLLVIPVALLVLAVPVCLIVRKKGRKETREEGPVTLTGWDVWQLTVPAACFFVTISKIGAYTKIRYMYPVVPVMVLAVMALLLFLSARMPKPRIAAAAAAAVMLAVSCLSWTTGDIHHLYIGYTNKLQSRLEPYCGTDMVMSWNGRNAVSTCLPEFEYYSTVTFYYGMKEEKLASFRPFQEGKDVILILGETQKKNGYAEKLQELFPGYEVTYLGKLDAQHKFHNYYFHKIQE